MNDSKNKKQSLDNTIFHTPKTTHKNSNYKINDFTKNNLNYTIFYTPESILTYKIAIWWIPILFYTVIMLILTLTVRLNNKTIELAFTFIAFVLYFIIYFITDVMYQFSKCDNTTKFDNILNSTYNAINISKFIALGYFIGIFLSDQQNFLLDTSQYSEYNSQFNNLLTSLIIGSFGMLYVNPVNRPNCSENIWCKKNNWIVNK